MRQMTSGTMMESKTTWHQPIVSNSIDYQLTLIVIDVARPSMSMAGSAARGGSVYGDDSRMIERESVIEMAVDADKEFSS